MVRSYWVVVGFGAGLLLGVIASRKLSDAPATPDPGVQASPVAQTTVSPAARAPAAPKTPAPQANVTPAIVAAPESAAVPPRAPGQSGAPVKTTISPYQPSVDSGVVQAIDVGAAFAKQINRPSQPGYENEIGDAHRALEREARDEQWAYAMEGELQNSLVAQASMGTFKVEHVECRTTLCEVRLSGQASGQAGLREWTESLNGLNKRLFPNMSSMVANDERVDALYIFRRPRKP